MPNKKQKLPVNVLLVDDKYENLVALEKTLGVLNVTIHKALSGNDALKMMLKTDFAVALVDVMMPDMNGFEVAKLMHENASTKHIPIIFVTAINKSETYMIQGMEVGAVDYLYKPIEPVVLLSKVRVFVDLYMNKLKLEKTIQELNYYQQQLEERNMELEQLSGEDSLTKLANRRAFEEQFAKLLELGKRYQRIVAVLFLDLDNFKLINDNYGHEAGDFLLKTLSNRLVEIARVEDILAKPLMDSSTKPSTVGRIGGDEFVLIAGDIGHPSNAHKIAERVRKVADDPIIYHDKEFDFSLSIGIALYPEAGKTVDELLRAADIALYKAKKSGKNTYHIYEKGDEV